MKTVLVPLLIFCMLLIHGNAEGSNQNNSKKLAAKVGNFEITWQDVDIELQMAGKHNPTDEEKKKMLEALVNRVLLTKAVENSKELSNDKYLRHLIRWCKYNISARHYLMAVSKEVKQSITDEQVEEYLKKNIDKINPYERRVIFVDVRCLVPQKCDKKKLKKAADEVYKLFLNAKGLPSDWDTHYRELTQKYGAFTISVPTELTAVSNLQSIWGSEDLVKKIFASPKGSVLKYKIKDHHYKILYIKDYENRRNEDWKAKQDAEIALSKELEKKKVEEKLKELKRKYNVKIYSNE